MNRTFLLLLMIGTAMMIAVIGQQKPAIHLDYTPWQLERLESGAIRVFGLTLGRSTIQETNQIFASFAETLLQVDMDNHYKLIARYDELTIGGLLAQLELTYDLDQQSLQAVFANLTTAAVATDENHGLKFYKLDNKTEMDYLSTPISGITYIPSIDYKKDIIRQRFGQANQETAMNEGTQLWLYPEFGLQIYIHDNKPDLFVYNSVKK